MRGVCTFLIIFGSCALAQRGHLAALPSNLIWAPPTRTLGSAGPPWQTPAVSPPPKIAGIYEWVNTYVMDSHIDENPKCVILHVFQRS